MNKLEYLKPNAEIIKFDNSDVITTSGEDSCPNNMKSTGLWWWFTYPCVFGGKEECTGPVHAAPGNSGKCIWFNGTYSIDDEDVW